MPSLNANNQGTNRPRVLFLARFYPYPPENAGDAVYSKGVIEAVAEACDVTVLCADSNGKRCDPKNIEWHVVGPRRAGRVGSVFSRWPLNAWQGATVDFHAALDSLLKRAWDVVVIDNLGSVHALPRAEKYRAENPHTKLVYISYEYEYPTRRGKYNAYRMSLPKKLMTDLDLKKVRETEEMLLKTCDVVTVINEDDVAPFKKIAPENKYLPLLPGYNGPVTTKRKITDETPRTVLILGGRRSEQKRQILLDWMHVAYERMVSENIKMIVVGDMEDSLRDTLTEKYPKTEILGFVDNLEALIATCRTGLIADTVGGGFKLRLLSHIFQRLPIIGLSGAIAGLPTPLGEGYLGSENLEDLLELVCDTIDDIDRLNALQNRAFEDCAKAFSWSYRAEAFARAVGQDGEAYLANMVWGTATDI